MNILETTISIVRNTGYMLFAQLISRSINFFYIIFLASYLTTESFGALNVALTTLIVADTIADAGLSRLIIRTLSRNERLTSSYIWRLLPLRIIFSIIAYGICISAVQAGGLGSDANTFITIIGVGLLFTGPAAIFESVLQSQQRFGFIGGAHVGLSLIQTISGIGVIKAGGGIVALGATFLLSNLTYLLVVLAPVLTNSGLGSMRFAPQFWLSQLPLSLPYAATAVLTIFSLRCELLIMSWVSSPVEIGFFSLALKFNEIAILIPILLSTVLVPVYSRYHQEFYESLSRSYVFILRWGLVCAVPSVVLGMLVVKPLIVTILPKYATAADLATIMLIAVPFYAVYQLNFAVLLGADRQRRTMLLLLGLSILQLVIGFAFIIPYSAKGAVVSYVAWAFAASIISTSLTRMWYLPGVSIFFAVAPALSGALAMAAALWIGSELHPAGQFVVAFAAYVPAVWIAMRVVHDRTT